MFQLSGGGEGGADLPLPGAGGASLSWIFSFPCPELRWMLSRPDRGDIPAQGHCLYKAQAASASPCPRLLISVIRTQ